MQTDAYDPEELSQWVASETGAEPEPEDTAEIDLGDNLATSPIDIVDPRLVDPRLVDPRLVDARLDDSAERDHDSAEHDHDAAAEAERASEAALRRWLAP